MFELLLLIGFIIFIRWLSKKGSSGTTDDVVNADVHSNDYMQGYHDGYQAHVKELKMGVKSPQVSMAQKVTLKHTDDERLVHRVIDKPAPHVAIKPESKQSQAQQLKQKAKDDLRNINTTLYVASFLLVAAAALFIGTSLPEFVRFMGIWLITITFYSAGLILYEKVEKLKPAAVAFTGTGLALLPFTGFAMYGFILNNASVCWFITSLISLAAFIIAAMRLKNEILSYLSIAFGISLAVSGVAVIDAGLIWYFVVTIMFGSLMTIISTLKPSWLPEYFSSPIQKTNNWIVPLTIISSLFAFNGMHLMDYWIISMVSAFYYGAVSASSIESRDTSLFVTRLLASLSIILMSYDLSDSWIVTSFAISFVGLAQSMISAIMLPKRTVDNSQNEIWLWTGLVMQLFAPLFVLNDVMWAQITITQLSIMMIASFGLAYWFNRVSLSSFGTISLAVIPVIFGNYIVEPALEKQWISLIFIGFAGLALAIRYVSKVAESSQVVRQYLVSNFGLFIIESLYFTFNISKGWGIVIWLMATALIYGLMFVERQPWLSIIANFMILISVLMFVEPIMEHHWIALIFMVLATISITLLSVEKQIVKSIVIRPFIVMNFGLFVIESLLFTGQVTAGWGIALWAAATIMVYILMYLERQPMLSILANVMIWILIFRYMSPTIESYWIASIFMALALISVAILSIEKQIKTTLTIRPYLVANFALFVIESLALTFGMNPEWSLALWVIATTAVYYVVYLEKQPALSLVANSMLLMSAIQLIDILKVGYLWQEIVLSWIAFAIFYSAYWYLETLSKKEYSVYYWWSAVVVAGLINLFSLMNDTFDTIVIAAGFGLSVVASAIIAEGWMSRKLLYIDAGLILATIGLQRAIGVTVPGGMNILVYTHWWAAVVALSSYIYYVFGLKEDSKNRSIIALGIISLFGGMAALGMIGVGYGENSSLYQIIFLIEHIIILVIGMAFSKKMYSVWGAVGAVLSVVWMIKGYTVLLLVIAAFSLIGAAIYALINQSKNSK